jgi:hypothetical protein
MTYRRIKPLLPIILCALLETSGCGTNQPSPPSNQNTSNTQASNQKSGVKPLQTPERFVLPQPSRRVRPNELHERHELTDTTKNSFSYHSGGIVLSNVNLRVIFWGKSWTSDIAPTTENPRPANVKPLTDAIRTMVTSNYLIGLSEYVSSIGKGALANAVTYSATDPNNSFTEADIENFVKDRIKDRTLPYPDDPNHLYLIVLPKGIKFQYNADGEHWFINYTEDDKPDWKQVHLGFAVNDGQLDSVTVVVSHELVEGVSNAELDAVYGVSESCGSASGTRQCELADACQYESSDNLTGGTVVSKYWSQKGKSCIAAK